MLEADYQAELIEKFELLIPNAIVLKNNPNYIQGIPDLSILGPKGKYVLLEVKTSEFERHQPNQDYYISVGKKFGAISEFIYPENEKTIIERILDYFGIN